MSGKVQFGKLSTESKGKGLAGVVAILASIYLAMVSIVCSCPSRTNSVTVSLRGAVHRRLSTAQRYYEKNELPDKMEVTGLPEDYEGFNGLYQREGSAWGSQLFPRLGGIGSRVGSRVGCQTGSKGGAKVGSTIGGKVGARVGKQKGGWIGEKLGGAAGSWTGSRTGSKLGCQTGSRVGSALGAQAGSQIDSRFGSQVGASFKNKFSDAKLDYQEGQWVLQLKQKRATCPTTENGRLPQHETWKLQNGQEVQIKMFALQVDPGHEGSSVSGGSREQRKGNEENPHDSQREGVPSTDGNTGSNRAKNDGDYTERVSKDSNPGRRDQKDNSVMTSVDGNQLADSLARDNLKGEVGSDVDQNDDLVVTGVDANHSADPPGQDNLNGEVGSDVDQNDDTVMSGMGANHTPDQLAQDGKVGSNVDQNADLVMTGVDANHSANSPGQDDQNGKVNSEIHGGETGQQNSGHQTRSNHSIARSISTAKADTTGTDHSIPAPAQDNLKGEPETDAHEGNKSQPKSDGQKNSYDSIAHSNRSGIAKSDRAHHITHGSKNSSLDQTTQSSLSHVDNFSTTELDYQGGNHSNITAEETTEVVSFHSILAIIVAVLSLMCACVCMAVSCFWRGSDHMMKENGGCWGVEDSESEAILMR